MELSWSPLLVSQPIKNIMDFKTRSASTEMSLLQERECFGEGEKEKKNRS